MKLFRKERRSLVKYARDFVETKQSPMHILSFHKTQILFIATTSLLLTGCDSLSRPSRVYSDVPTFYGLSLNSNELVNTEDKNFNKSLNECEVSSGEEFKCVVMFTDEFFKQQEYVIEIEETLNGCSD